MNAAERVKLMLLPMVLFTIALSVVATELPEKEWERIDLDEDHTSIEAKDKSRRNSAIPTETVGDLAVPEFLKLHRVVSIGTLAFDGCRQITSVNIPEGVTNIADYAFYNCSSLTNVIFPSTLKSIGSSAFIGCQKLGRVNIEAPRLTIGDRAFRDCDGLQTVRFVGDELRASTRAFFGCGGLRDVNLIVKDITLSEGVFSGGYDSYSCGYCDHLTNVLVAASNRVELGESVFAGCSALQQVALTAGAEMNVGSTAFSGCTALRQATLTAGAEAKVGASAFSSGSGDQVSFGSCNHLVYVLMVASNRVELGSSVFSGCTALQAIELPEGLVGVPQNAFAYCSSLQSVSLPSNVVSIAYRAFDTCTSLTNVWLNDGLSAIESQAFYECALKRLEFPQSVSSVGSRAFEMCGDLESVLFREHDTNRLEATALELGERAFYRCDALNAVRLPQRLLFLPARVFADCERLASINLPSNLTDIAESAFESCTSLQHVDFPMDLASIGAMAFNDCSELTGFSIPTNRIVDLGDKAFVRTKYWNEWPDDSLVENNGYILGFKGNPTSVELPEGCVAIPAEMFMGMTALTNVVVPPSVKKVGLRAFAGSGVLNVVLPNVTELGVSAFENCVNLETVVLAEGLGVIPNLAFHQCVSLQAIDIPKSVRSIGSEAFRDCVSLQDVTGCKGVKQVGDYAFAGCVKLQPFRLGNDVEYGDHVFQAVEWTENVLFPNVGTMAQEYPNSYFKVRSVVISSSLSEIVERACAGCAALEEVVIPDGVASIGAMAFDGCSSLASLVVPTSVENVGSNAFRRCGGIVSLTTSGFMPVREMLPDSFASIREFSIAEGATSLCSQAFAGCVGLVSLNIPATVTSIGDSAFAGCIRLVELNMPTTVTSIGESAFSGCSGLTEVTMPSSLTSIGDHAFLNCSSLKTVWFTGGTPNAKPNIYEGTPKDLRSMVRPEHRDTWKGSSFDTLFQHWPDNGDHGSKEYRQHSRRIGWWVDDTGAAHAGGDDDLQTWEEAEYDAGTAHTYDGYLLDGEAVAGTFSLSVGKGVYDRDEESTRVKMTAKALVLGEGKTLSLNGTAYDVDEFGGFASLAKGEREAEIEFSQNVISGWLDGFDVVGVRNVFDGKTDQDKQTARSAVEGCVGNYVAVLDAVGDSPLSQGAVVLTISVSANGKCKVSGCLPDGTKVSANSRLMVVGDHCELPVVVPLYSGKRGGFGFNVVFSKETGPSVDNVSNWIANPGKPGAFVAELAPVEAGIGRSGVLESTSMFSVDAVNFDLPGADVEDRLLPDGVEVLVAGRKWSLPKADKVVFDRQSGSYEVLTDYGNAAGLKLTFTPATGAFKGSFKVYATGEGNRAKTSTVQVAGVVLDGVGYGSAFIKGVAAMSVSVIPIGGE